MPYNTSADPGHMCDSDRSNTVDSLEMKECLSLLGIETDVLNTVQFSNHTQYGQWEGLPTPTEANPLGDDRFGAMFTDERFQVDESTEEYKLRHPPVKTKK